VRFVVIIALAACGSKSDPADPDAGERDAEVERMDGGSIDDAETVVVDAPPDAFPAVLDLQINCRNDCVLIANPAAISVSAGTEFEVNWINVGDTECDVAKIDPFNQVPIIIGLEPGTSHHDSVRQWCGPFTGTFDFRVTICTLHSFIPVDCGA
jgi:hypothetical protein